MAAPLSSGFLFGEKIQEAVTADKNGQLHASLKITLDTAKGPLKDRLLDHRQVQ
ncbi:hypothetical protein DPMN_075397 [Dreissena polymorpha]|uniref:Uncharacterized protein n=1 Tax=Dreissena polymorpha TaxID=45954 RepID=A0A9D3YL06_DREPO|nr:hypothetical protein DPMN_075397 [Dreissena polymorpha]